MLSRAPHFSGASLMGFDPSQCCSCPQAAGCFHRAGPTCRLLSVRPGLRFLCREINRLLPSNARVAPTVNELLGRTVDPGRSPRLLGFTCGQSAPGDSLDIAPADTALGFGRSIRSVGHGFSRRASQRHHPPESSTRASLCRTGYPLLGLGSGRVTRCWAKQLPRHGTPWPSLQRFWRLMPVRFRMICLTETELPV